MVSLLTDDISQFIRGFFPDSELQEAKQLVVIHRYGDFLKVSVGFLDGESEQVVTLEQLQEHFPDSNQILISIAEAMLHDEACLGQNASRFYQGLWIALANVEQISFDLKKRVFKRLIESSLSWGKSFQEVVEVLCEEKIESEFILKMHSFLTSELGNNLMSTDEFEVYCLCLDDAIEKTPDSWQGFVV